MFFYENIKTLLSKDNIGYRKQQTFFSFIAIGARYLSSARSYFKMYFPSEKIHYALSGRQKHFWKSVNQGQWLMICCLPLDFSVVAVQISCNLSNTLCLHYETGWHVSRRQNNLRIQVEWKRSSKHSMTFKSFKVFYVS